MHFLQVLFVLLSLITIVIAWPDGAPCIHAVYESMNPLEAVEHQGGLQLTVPPYHIEVRQKCYWINQPVEIILRGNTSMDRFRGFAMQPISYKGPNRGKRVGQFLRLDDNGSWQQQCFRFKDSVTHSHEEKKKQIKLWWKNELNDDDYVQFVATVVKAQKEFWVKSIKSIPVAPCRIERNGIQGYKPEPITPPPPANQFKLDTFRLFDAVDDELRQNMLETIPNDADPIRKPQRIQDFFKICLAIIK
uniref:Reelin domain-containing protein n=2 Tax=Onchocerca TaxID=6281 RepID=A0A8R1XXN9_ONCVO